MTDAEFKAWLKTPDAIRTALVEVIAKVGGVETTLYLSSRPFVSRSTDTPATTPYEHCIVGGVTFSEHLSLDGTPSISYGDIEIENRGGVRDAWLDPATYIWMNRRVRVYMGDPRWARVDFRLVFDGIVADIDARDAEVLNLRLVDKLQKLNVPMTESTLGGSTANKGKTLPLCFGECFNVEPLLTNPATLTYQVHSGGAIEDIIEVRSNGYVPVAITKNLAAGTFTLGANPASTTITASVQGYNGASFLTTVASVVKDIVKYFGPVNTQLVDADLDLTQLAAFDAAYPQTIGLYASDRMNVLEACQQLAASVGAQVVMTTLGLLRLIPLTLTGLGAATAATDEDFEEKSLHISTRTPVKATCRLGFNRNWKPMDTLAAALPASTYPLFREEWLVIKATDATTQANYKLDTSPPMEETLLQIDTEASTEAARRRDLWKVPRHVYTARYFSHMLLTELGDVIQITHDRFGLSGGKTGIVVEIERDWLKGRIQLGVLA